MSSNYRRRNVSRMSNKYNMHAKQNQVKYSTKVHRNKTQLKCCTATCKSL